MPQNFFEPRTPVRRTRPPGVVAGVERARSEGESARVPKEKVEPVVGAGPPGDEPSWVRIYWNTLRSFVRRRLGLGPLGPRGGEAGRPAHRRAVVVVVVGLALVAGLIAVAVAVTGGGTGTDARRTQPRTGDRRNVPVVESASPEVRGQVVTWVVGHVGPGQVVACDAAVCGALASAGFPASSLVALQDSAQDVQSADVAVLTATVRSRLGAGVDALTAAEPLAVFGTGGQAVSVRAVAHAGRAAYGRAVTADRGDRAAAGKALLANKRLVFRAGSDALLAHGQVDLRICALLAALGGSGHTVTVDSFGPPSPGAGLDMPRTALFITAVDRAPATGNSQSAVAVRQLIAAQQAPYKPLTTLTRPARAASPAALSVLYAQPSPLGLVDHPTP